MKEIELSQGKVALVDDDMYEYLSQWKWSALKCFDIWYAIRNSPCDEGGNRRMIYMHRQIIEARPGERADHQDRDGLNNQRENLRLCTRSQNRANAKKTSGCSSQYKGVYWHKARGKWHAHIGIKGEIIYLGLFNDEIEAAFAYNKAATEHFGEFARLNVIESISS